MVFNLLQDTQTMCTHDCGYAHMNILFKDTDLTMQLRNFLNNGEIIIFARELRHYAYYRRHTLSKWYKDHIIIFSGVAWTWPTFIVKYNCDIIDDNLIEPEVLSKTVCLSQQTLEL